MTTDLKQWEKKMIDLLEGVETQSQEHLRENEA